ncbi:hypothetical protein [Mesobacillus subterraneus]|uniref:Uncharacterized protein n=1 Tax=Mesobacillus subterraneus TaxID=285983 RepID=A0A3R9KSC7_9BACI|nr:hypothetical protein [Mesobacillus subterraneus]RSD25003.1 hypothetical protein EJA10_18615 [Mesobacillus subterraneus]
MTSDKIRWRRSENVRRGHDFGQNPVEQQRKCPKGAYLRTKSGGAAVKMFEDGMTSDKIRWRSRENVREGDMTSDKIRWSSSENVRRWHDFGQNPIETGRK